MKTGFYVRKKSKYILKCLKKTFFAYLFVNSVTDMCYFSTIQYVFNIIILFYFICFGEYIHILGLLIYFVGYKICNLRCPVTLKLAFFLCFEEQDNIPFSK